MNLFIHNKEIILEGSRIPPLAEFDNGKEWNEVRKALNRRQKRIQLGIDTIHVLSAICLVEWIFFLLFQNGVLR